MPLDFLDEAIDDGRLGGVALSSTIRADDPLRILVGHKEGDRLLHHLKSGRPRIGWTVNLRVVDWIAVGLVCHPVLDDSGGQRKELLTGEGLHARILYAVEVRHQRNEVGTIPGICWALPVIRSELLIWHVVNYYVRRRSVLRRDGIEVAFAEEYDVRRSRFMSQCCIALMRR